jgi:glycosyltransferase involved in cell wall biosynthesis
MIAIVSTTHGSGHGAEVVLSELLRVWHDERLPLTVVAPGGSAPATAASALGVPWVPLHASRDALLTNLIAGHRAAPSLRSCRLVHAWSARGLELSWWIGRRLGVASTATVHDHPDSATQTRLRRRLWRVTANLQDALAFPSAALEKVWRAAGFRRPSRVVPNGSSELHPLRRDREREAVVIGFLGMYAPWKGFEIARSWARAGWPADVRWVFFGEPSAALRSAVTELVAEVGPQVRFAGAQPREQIFGEIDVLVHCSTAFDPFPTVLLEAAERGVPAVASSLGGAGEIVVHDETGFLFDPAAAEAGLVYLRRLVADPGLRARLGAAARIRFERLFRAERMAEGYATLWRDVLAGVLKTLR